jgi:hypothetical protein
VPKPSVRLYPIDIELLPWLQPDSAGAGVREKILCQDPGNGSLTRILEVDPNVPTGVLVHEFWEEALILRGSYKAGDAFHPTGTFECFPPGVEHGPILSTEGYVNLELRDHHGPGMDKPPAVILPVDQELAKWVPLGTAASVLWEKRLVSGSSGSYTRILRLDRGHSVEALPFEWFEETYVLSGSCKTGDDFHPTGTYVSRAPGDPRGRVATMEGCTWLQVCNV